MGHGHSLRHGEVGARGRGERRRRAAESCPSQAQAKRLLRSAHLLSIRLEQHGLPFHAAAYVHLELKKCCGFLELEVDHVIGCEKALRSTVRNRDPDARGYYEELLRGGRNARSAIAENIGSG